MATLLLIWSPCVVLAQTQQALLAGACIPHGSLSWVYSIALLADDYAWKGSDISRHFWSQLIVAMSCVMFAGSYVCRLGNLFTSQGISIRPDLQLTMRLCSCKSDFSKARSNSQHQVLLCYACVRQKCLSCDAGIHD